MLVLTIVTVLQFCRLRYKMLVRSINLSLWYYVKDNVVLQALCSSSNCLYTKSKSTILQPLKGELRYELSRSKWSNSDSSSSGFLFSNWLKGAMSRAKIYCGNKLFTLVFITWGLNVLTLNVTTPDTIVSVIWIKKTYCMSHISTNLYTGLPLIFNVYFLTT